MALPTQSSPWMTIICRSIAFAAVLAVGIASAVMNARFGYQLGEDPTAKAVLMAFSVAVDVFKWVAPVLAAIAWQQGARVRASAAVILWLVAGVWSFAAAIGFSALNRDVTMAGRTAVVSDKTRADSAWHRADQTLTTLLASPRWNATKACTDATAPASITYCAEVKEARAALANADARLNDAPPMASVDPQAEFFARTFGIELPRAQLALTLFLAVVAELFSMLGLFVATSSAARPPQTPVTAVLTAGPPPVPPDPPQPIPAPAASAKPQFRPPPFTPPVRRPVTP